MTMCEAQGHRTARQFIPTPNSKKLNSSLPLTTKRERQRTP